MVHSNEPASDVPTLPDRSNGSILQDIEITHQDYQPGQLKHKKGDRKLPNNYRLISLTSIFCRILESIIKDRIMSYFTLNNFFSKEQHGFRRNRSCETQLLSIMKHWSRVIDDGINIDVIYLDFQKAFDKVPHQRLLSKLKAYGIQGKVFDWIENFLSRRKQRVAVCGSYSNWTDVISGVPQGSVLGPTLFIMYVNDLPDYIKSSLRLFADDTKIYRPITSPNDIDLLQQDLNLLLNWCGTWLSSLNFIKCKHMSIGQKSTANQYYFYLDNEAHQICTVKEEKDLGVIFDEHLHFSTHIKEIIHKANNVLGTIKQTFNSRDANLIRLLYTTLVRPILDCSSTIWNPYQMGVIRELENVQRRATKLIPSLQNLTCSERLQNLYLPSLSYHRNRTDLIITYQILNENVLVDKDYFFALNTSHTRSNGFKIYKKDNRTSTRHFTFSQRIINDWNYLPNDVVTFPNVLTFKSKLENFMYNQHFSFI